MKTIHIFLLFAAVCALLVGGPPKTAVSKAAPAVVAIDDIGASANQELAAARRATAKYHDIEEAIADGYVQATGCIVGEGFHFNKTPFDCEFDPEAPEGLHYVLKPNGDFKLVSVEYFVPRNATCGFTPPDGFTGDADVWGLEMGGAVFNLNAWIWFANPEGVFDFSNSKITCD